jgi:hypothetical protein
MMVTNSRKVFIIPPKESPSSRIYLKRIAFFLKIKIPDCGKTRSVEWTNPLSSLI